MKELLSKYLIELLRISFKCFFVFPIKQNCIMFESYVGKEYSCNPKYIFLELLERQENYEMIWSFRNPERNDLDKSNNNVKVVKTYSFKYWYYRLTAKITVTNLGWKKFTPIRKKQYEIQTWHGGGGGYKKSINDNKAINKNEILLKSSLKKHSRYSLVLSSSRTSLKTNARSAMQYKGPVLGGTPRNDIFFKENNSEIDASVRKYFGLSQDTKIVLYAPTWRTGATSEDFDIDYILLQDSLADKFGGEWVTLRRMHRNAIDCLDEVSNNCISAESYPDMQELLSVVDVLITDYSSSIWDYSFTYKPCFLLCLDLNKYIDERDFYNPITSWGFSVAESNEELAQNIKEFDQKKYKNSMIEQHEKNGSMETGNISKEVCEIIYSQCYGTGEIPESIVVHTIEE